jgi:diguanylate cyclase (GGDEF)-like protein
VKRAVDRRLGLLLLAVAGSVAATQFSGPSGSVAYRVTLVVSEVLGLVYAGVGAWRHRHTLGAIGWLLFLTPTFQLLGDLGISYDTLIAHTDPFPSWIDGVYLSAYVTLTAALQLVIRRRRLGPNPAAVIDTLTITVGVGVLAWCFVIADTAGDSTTTVAARLVGALYPFLDVLLFGAVTRLLISASEHRSPLFFMAGGVLSLFAGDVGYDIAVYGGGRYDSWIDAVYLFSALTISSTLWLKDTDRLVDTGEPPAQRLSAVRLGALAVGGLLAPVTVLVQTYTGGRHLRAAAFGGLLLFVLTLLRMFTIGRALQRQSEQLTRQARTDGLTGLANRRTFDLELERVLDRAADAGRTLGTPHAAVSLAILDLDHFKQFNDTHGHGGGDQLLRECAAHWSDGLDRISPGAFLARYGGEEFVIIFPARLPEHAIRVTRQLLAVTPMGQSFSAGVAGWDGAEPARELLTRADDWLYRAKRAGRKRVLGDERAGHGPAAGEEQASEVPA